jgi:hypothetical protein
LVLKEVIEMLKRFIRWLTVFDSPDEERRNAKAVFLSVSFLVSVMFLFAFVAEATGSEMLGVAAGTSAYIVFYVLTDRERRVKKRLEWLREAYREIRDNPEIRETLKDIFLLFIRSIPRLIWNWMKRQSVVVLVVVVWITAILSLLDYLELDRDMQFVIWLFLAIITGNVVMHMWIKEMEKREKSRKEYEEKMKRLRKRHH